MMKPVVRRVTRGVGELGQLRGRPQVRVYHRDTIEKKSEGGRASGRKSREGAWGDNQGREAKENVRSREKVDDLEKVTRTRRLFSEEKEEKGQSRSQDEAR